MIARVSGVASTVPWPGGAWSAWAGVVAAGLAGGVVTTLLDHVCGMAVWTALDRSTSIATLDLRIDYMRPAKPGLDLLARARCYKLTRSVAFVRAWAYGEGPDDAVAAAPAAFVL